VLILRCRSSLFGVAAISGWLDTFSRLPALDLLAARIATALPEAVLRVQAGDVAVIPQLAAARPTVLLTAGREDGADEWRASQPSADAHADASEQARAT
jgi:hypothetical protein